MDRVNVIIGANGRIGREYVRYLINEKNQEVISVSRIPNPEFSQNPLVKSVVGQDLIARDWKNLEIALDRDDLRIFYLAGRHNTPNGVREDYTSIHVDAPKRLISLASKKQNPFIYFSSDHVFGNAVGRGFSEDSIPDPRQDYYGYSKRVGELETLAYSEGYVLRSETVLGIEGDFLDTSLRKLRRGGECEVWEDHYHKFAGINQVCLTLAKIAKYQEMNELTTDSNQHETPDSFGRQRVFHVAFDDVPMSMHHLVKSFAVFFESRGLLSEGAHKKAKLIPSPGGPRSFSLNTDLTRRELGLQGRKLIPSLQERRVHGYLDFDKI